MGKGSVDPKRAEVKMMAAEGCSLAKPKLPFALRPERRTPFHLCRPLGRMEGPQIRESSCGLAPLSQASLMSRSHRSIAVRR